MARLTRTQHYQWAVLTWHCLRTFVAVGTCNFAEYKIEGDEDFIDAACRLKYSLAYPELENKCRKLLERQTKKLAKEAEETLPEGQPKLTAEDCKAAFLRFLFLTDLMLMKSLYGYGPFATGKDWTYCQQWIRGAVHLYESKAGAEPLPEETWADKKFAKLCNILNKEA